jgi:tryptophanyl-tRNA synthetase
MQKTRILTGITTSGTPHLGNYVGAIRPAIAASRNPGAESFYFLADYHALIKCDDPARIRQSTLEIAASWLACGLDPEKVYFYRQSDIPEIPELTWLLTCVTAKGLLNRAHAYKAAVDQNRAVATDNDDGITAGLYMYPVLMAADILAFNANNVPVGRDQVQHIEMARDIGQRFNHIYGNEYFTLPEAAIEENVATLPGLDGRKMSKSYNNTIPLWLPEKELRKAILGIVTNSQALGEAKSPDESHIFSIYQAFASAEETAAMRKAFAEGIGWGDAKQKLFERINSELAPMRERYETLIAKPVGIEEALHAGAKKARAEAQPFLARLRGAVGLRSLDTKPEMATKRKTSAMEKPVAERKLWKDPNDNKFYFRLVDQKGNSQLTSSAFVSKDEALSAYNALVDYRGPESAEALQIISAASVDNGYRFEFRFQPDARLLAYGPLCHSEDESSYSFHVFLEQILKPLQGIPGRI